MKISLIRFYLKHILMKSILS